MQNEELRKAQHELQISRDNYFDFYNFSTVGYFTFEEEGLILDLKLTSATFLGGEKQKLIIRNFGPWISPDSRPAFNTFCKKVLEADTKQTCELKLIVLAHVVLMEGISVPDADGHGKRIRAIMIDITERKETEKELIEMEETLLNASREWRTTFDAITDIVWLADNEGKILRCNLSATKFFNKPFNEILGHPCYEVMHNTSGPIEGCPHLRMKETNQKEMSSFQIGDRWFNISADPIFNEANSITGTVHTISDITSQKRAEEELRELSLKDHLTGLLNHRGFFTLAEQQLKLAHRMKKRLVLVFADLDRMKWINDSLGHNIGDLALQEAAQVLNETFRESDIIARIGGDEFAIFGLDIAHESTDVITARLHKNLKHYNSMPDRNYSLSLSVGISRYDFENPCSVEELLSQADQSMYEQKRNKKPANSE
jgi:diguanylate cyclase (GGDEF)-like protein/PAS domain S-box-containing protein